MRYFNLDSNHPPPPPSEQIDQKNMLFQHVVNVEVSVDIRMPYISGRDHARKLKFSSYVHLPSINKMF